MSQKRTTEGALSSSQGARCTQEGQGPPALHANLVCTISARSGESQETLGPFLYQTFDAVLKKTGLAVEWVTILYHVAQSAAKKFEGRTHAQPL